MSDDSFNKIIHESLKSIHNDNSEIRKEQKEFIKQITEIQTTTKTICDKLEFLQEKKASKHDLNNLRQTVQNATKETNSNTDAINKLQGTIDISIDVISSVRKNFPIFVKKFTRGLFILIFSVIVLSKVDFTKVDYSHYFHQLIGIKEPK